MQEEGGVAAGAATELHDVPEAEGIPSGVLEDQPHHPLGHLLLDPCFPVVGAAGFGEAFGYQSFVHTSCRYR